MQKLALALLIITLSSLSSVQAASWTQQINDRSLEYLLPEERYNPERDNPVNLSFKDTKLSHVLLLLSKVANLNIIFPQELDRNVSVNLNNKSALDAIKEVLTVNDLQYTVIGETVKVSKFDISKPKLHSVTLRYSNAQKVSDILNGSLFKELIASRPAYASKPYAFVPPSQNAVLLSGNNEQIKAAKDLIAALDQKPALKLVRLEKLSAQDAIKTIKEELKYSNLEINEEASLKSVLDDQQNTIKIVGPQEEVEMAIEIIKDKESQIIDPITN